MLDEDRFPMSAACNQRSARIVAGPANWNEMQRGVCFDFSNDVKMDFLLTYRCNAACSHCITQSNPQRREALSFAEIAATLEAGALVGKKYVAFTGGEP